MRPKKLPSQSDDESGRKEGRKELSMIIHTARAPCGRINKQQPVIYSVRVNNASMYRQVKRKSRVMILANQVAYL
jgi:hypothetical protein